MSTSFASKVTVDIADTEAEAEANTTDSEQTGAEPAGTADTGAAVVVKATSSANTVEATSKIITTIAIAKGSLPRKY